MLFSNILGQDYIKNHLTRSVDNGRIPHAQLFVGPEGCGTLPMAIAYAQYILCNNTNGENNSGKITKKRDVTKKTGRLAQPQHIVSHITSAPLVRWIVPMHAASR